MPHCLPQHRAGDQAMLRVPTRPVPIRKARTRKALTRRENGILNGSVALAIPLLIILALGILFRAF